MDTPYDALPYPCHAYPQIHPGHLALIARLKGMSPASPHRCRYLEVGCGDGGNLLPLAYALPNSEFMGIDLAHTSIEAAIRHREALKLKNLEFRTMDILDLASEELGSWDYIVAHGVFSWVPEPARFRLLELCRKMLAPQGIAFVSYNAYPGCHVRHMFRDMMMFHTENAPDPASKINQSWALMKFLSDNREAGDEYGVLLQAESKRILGYDPNHFFHDDLAEINQPYYLHEFVDLAAERDLKYVADADYTSMFPMRFSPAVRKALADLGDDPVRQEQYLDFFKCRRFRQSLLCRSEVALEPSTPAGRMREFHFASQARRVTEGASLLDDSPVEFEGPEGPMGESSMPLTKVALACLGNKWPGRWSFDALLQAVSSSLGEEPALDALEVVLLELAQKGSIEIHLSVEPFATEIAERPTVSGLARYQSQQGEGITNLRHQTLHVQDKLGLWLIEQFNGTRTPAEVAHSLASRAKPDTDGKIDFEKELGEAEGLVNQGLQQLYRLGLVLPPEEVGSSQ